MSNGGTTAWLRPAATWLAVASIVLVLVNAAIVLRNQSVQRELNQRQATINQAAQIARVNQVLIETIARTAVTKKDDALAAVLERHGVKLNGPVQPAPTPPEKTP